MNIFFFVQMDDEDEEKDEEEDDNVNEDLEISFSAQELMHIRNEIESLVKTLLHLLKNGSLQSKPQCVNECVRVRIFLQLRNACEIVLKRALFGRGCCKKCNSFGCERENVDRCKGFGKLCVYMIFSCLFCF